MFVATKRNYFSLPADVQTQPADRKAHKKKADVVEIPKEFDHVGLLDNEPPEGPGCSF